MNEKIKRLYPCIVCLVRDECPKAILKECKMIKKWKEQNK